MADAAERSLAAGGQAAERPRIRLKWPNDLVAEWADGSLRKLAGVLGETIAADGQVDRAIVGIGINADWPAEAFPDDLAATMTSLRELAGGRSIDRDRLLDDFLDGLVEAYHAFRDGRPDSGFEPARWAARQITTGRQLEVLVGEERLEGRGIGVDTETGSLLLESLGAVRAIDSGEVVRCRVIGVPGGV
jgi:BirA family biotin operon repressor/biotin-[acetyl-CoA-carboxylase] ligase